MPISDPTATQPAGGQQPAVPQVGGQNGGQQGGLNGGAKLADDFDTFLGLLVSQLENQDPLDPMKANEFTNQLVQFSTVEQAIATNDKLDKMLEGQAGNRATQAVDFIGKKVEMDGNQVALENGSTSFGYTLEEPAKTGALLISDAAGEVVKTAPISPQAGRHAFTWDGSTDQGGTAPDGVYSIQVRAVDENNKTVPASTQTRGEVTGFEIRDDKIFLSLGDREVRFDQVKAVHDATAGSAS